jgi:hypothetical protein
LAVDLFDEPTALLQQDGWGDSGDASEGTGGNASDTKPLVSARRVSFFLRFGHSCVDCPSPSHGNPFPVR